MMLYIQSNVPIQSNTDYADRVLHADGPDEDKLPSLTYQYYSLPSTKYLLAEQMRQREIVLFREEDGDNIVIRPLFVSQPSTKYVDWLYEFFNFKTKAIQTKLYATIFKINWDITGFPPKDLRKLSEFRMEFNNKFNNALIEADFVMDIDGDKDAIKHNESTPADEFLKTKQWALFMHDKLMQTRIPHLVNFSGGCGFNIRIPAAYLPPWQEWYDSAQQLAAYFAKTAGVPTEENGGVDLNVYDTRRIFKVLYSLSNGKIVLPVNTHELWDYTFEDYDFILAFRKQTTFYNHYTEHPKAPDEYLMKPGAVYAYGEQGKQNLKKIIEAL